MSIVNVKNANEGLSYLTDCILATIETIYTFKKINKSNLSRQILIAQSRVDLIKLLQIDVCNATRVNEVIHNFYKNVLKWSDDMLSKHS